MRNMVDGAVICFAMFVIQTSKIYHCIIRPLKTVAHNDRNVGA